MSEYTPYEEGYLAGMHGQGDAMNPFKPHQPGFESWQRGHEDGLAMRGRTHV